MRNTTIKKEFGKLLKASRMRVSMTRQAMANMLGVAVQTIQSWEDGRTFPTDLSIIDDLDRETGIYIPTLLDETIKNIRDRKRK